MILYEMEKKAQVRINTKLIFARTFEFDNLKIV